MLPDTAGSCLAVPLLRIPNDRIEIVMIHPQELRILLAQHRGRSPVVSQKGPLSKRRPGAELCHRVPTLAPAPVYLFQLDTNGPGHDKVKVVTRVSLSNYDSALFERFEIQSRRELFTNRDRILVETLESHDASVEKPKLLRVSRVRWLHEDQLGLARELLRCGPESGNVKTWRPAVAVDTFATVLYILRPQPEPPQLPPHGVRYALELRNGGLRWHRAAGKVVRLRL